MSMERKCQLSEDVYKRQDLGDDLTGQIGLNRREVGYIK